MATKTFHMIGPDGADYDIPEQYVHGYSSRGFRFATTPVRPPVPEENNNSTAGLPGGVPWNSSTSSSEIMTGVQKEATNLTYNVGKLGYKYLPGADRQMVPRIEEAQREDAADGSSALQTRGQKFGGFMSDMALFSAVAEASPFAGKGLTALAANGAVTGGVGTALASGGDPRETATGAALGATTPLLLRGAAAMGKRGSSWLLNNALEVPKSVYARMNPGEYAIEHGSFDWDVFNPMRWVEGGAGKDAIRDSAAAQAKVAARNINNLATSAPGRTSIASVQKLASDRATQWGAEGNADFLQKADDLFNLPSHTAIDITGNRPMQVYFPDKMQSTEAARNFLHVERPPTVTPRDLLDIRRGLSTQAGWNSNPLYHKQTIDLAQGMYGQTNELLHDMVPGLQAQDTAYSNLGTIGKLTDFKPSLWPWMMTGEVGAAVADREGSNTLMGAAKNMALYAAARAPAVPYTLGRGSLGLQAATPMLTNAFLAGHSRSTAPSSMFGNSMDRLQTNGLHFDIGFNPSDMHGTN
jgi:hypothetical protein